MKVLDLQCAHSHVFEGWFGSDDEFQSQLALGLIECPMCGDSTIVKRLSAPRLNLGPSRDVTETPQSSSRAVAQSAEPSDSPVSLQHAWMQVVRHVMANTEDVGSQFAEEARRMHYGETEERNIRGQASAEETASLLDEGIAVLPLAIPKALKEPLQ